MNDTKVVRYDPDSSAYGYFLGMRKAEYGDYVTHADYRALEDENRSLRASFDEANKLYRDAREELASLRARVGHVYEVYQCQISGNWCLTRDGEEVGLWGSHERSKAFARKHEMEGFKAGTGVKS